LIPVRTASRFLILLISLALLQSVSQGSAVYFVATNGNDSANGTSLATPWLTISKAAATMTNGCTVYIRGGTYREAIVPANGGSSTNSRVTYSAYDGEQVIISGADIYTNWTKSGNNWKLSWTTNLNSQNTNLVFRRELVIVDGAVLSQVTTLGEVVPGKFYVDGPSDGSNPTNIYMRTPDDTAPSGHVVEKIGRASCRERV
jgi:hypothetical protein